MQTTETTEAESLTDDEIAALTADAPAEEGTCPEAFCPEAFCPEAFCPDTADKVDWVLGKINAARAEARLLRENMERMARACERDAEALEWKYGPALQMWLEAELAASKGNSKSKRLPHGVIGYRTKPAVVCVTDPAALLTWTKENLPEAVTEALDKKALTARLLETGEAADGARLIPAEETFYLK